MLNPPALALRAKTRRVKVKGRETALTYKYNIYCGAPTNGRPPPERGVRGCLATALSLSTWSWPSDCLIKAVLEHEFLFSKEQFKLMQLSLLIDITVEPIAFASFPCVVYEARENFKVLSWCSRHRYDLI